VYIKPQTAIPASIRINRVDVASRVSSKPLKPAYQATAGFRVEERPSHTTKTTSNGIGT
jgi:hypothetical protein